MATEAAEPAQIVHPAWRVFWRVGKKVASVNVRARDAGAVRQFFNQHVKKLGPNIHILRIERVQP